MGLFDTITFHDDGAPRCAAGHRLGELQTKDLECVMESYSVLGGRIYCLARIGTTAWHVDARARLVCVETRIGEPAVLSADLRGYGHCHDCKPVLFLRGAGAPWDLVQERRPWCEWRLVVRNGVVERVEPVRVASRADVADELRREGLEVLADDERLARLHFKRTGPAARGP